MSQHGRTALAQDFAKLCLFKKQLDILCEPRERGLFGSKFALELGCEGLRVLGTWKKPGWGLEITEIGRTGIFSPHNRYVTRGNRANPQQKLRKN